MFESDKLQLNYSFAKDHGLILLTLEDEAEIGMLDNAKFSSLLEARRVLRRPLKIRPLSLSEFNQEISQIYSLGNMDSKKLNDELVEENNLNYLAEGLPEPSDLLDSADDAPVIRLINGLITEGVKCKASDIHIEPFDKKLIVRLRLDGILKEILSLSHTVSSRLVSRIKVMARLDIAERRIPQDGRISLAIGDKSLDVRVSTLPSQYGERVVLRLLDKADQQLNIIQLGMSKKLNNQFQESLLEPNGIVLVAGPTGSGKTTSLYAGITFLNDQSRNILTVEDPVEYALLGIGQTQVNTKVGMDFATGLRAILRQDPDVVMVGEIRDRETAEIAIQASLTGHLVLSTIHTNSAVSVVTRLKDMGIEPFLLSSTIKAIISQRLVRKLCDFCKKPSKVTSAEYKIIETVDDSIKETFAANGCDKCGFTGFSGRFGIYEAVFVNENIKKMIHNDSSEKEISDYAFKKSNKLIHSGIQSVVDGYTSLDEVLRICREEVSDHEYI